MLNLKTSMINEDGFIHFKLSEFDCQETGENEIDHDFVHKLDNLRSSLGYPLRVTSGYRSPSHSIEKRKAKPGTHAQGIAADILVTDAKQRGQIIKKAIEMGFTGIGMEGRFVHLDIRDDDLTMWTY